MGKMGEKGGGMMGRQNKTAAQQHKKQYLSVAEHRQNLHSTITQWVEPVEARGIVSRLVQ